RLDSIDALRPKADDPQVREAMSEALRHDPNPAVRLRAIEALRGAGSAPDVQSAILEALSDDDNSGVRIQALNALLERMRSHNFFRDAAARACRESLRRPRRARRRSADFSFILCVSRKRFALFQKCDPHAREPSTHGQSDLRQRRDLYGRCQSGEL